MPHQYEYKFVRLGDSGQGVREEAVFGYQESVHEHAAAGWRLVQIFAPGVAGFGVPPYYELVLERERTGC